MNEERNKYQIIRKDAKNCFVESLNDMFQFGRIHIAFASYDMTRPAGHRQTNNIHIYITADEFLEVCRKVTSGELRSLLQERKKTGDRAPLFQWLGGTSADKLRKMGKPRADGQSLSRVAQVVAGQKSDLLFIADSGPGEKDRKGLIVPRFGNKPENHVAVSMTLESFSELMLLTRAHYQAWLTAQYMQQPNREANPKTMQLAAQEPHIEPAPVKPAAAMF